jgi:hypothetical protein
MNFLRRLPRSSVLLPRCQLRYLGCSAGRLKTFEPDYLDSAGPQVPTYPPLNIQVQ